MSTRRGDWLWFGAWAVVGGCWCLALATLLTIGVVFVAPVALVLTVLLLLGLRRGSAVGLPGLLSGPSAVIFYIGWLNRGGPGDVCTSTATEQTCQTEWNPVPFLVAGSLVLVAGLLLFLLIRRQLNRGRTRRSPAGGPAGLRFTA